MAEIRNLLVLSTGHVSRETATMLDDTPPRQWPVTGGPYGEYGWFLAVYYMDQDYPEHMPADLLRVLRHARALGCNNVLLDCDAEKSPDLPVYEW